MNITQPKRRIMAVGCSHGNRANAGALDAALRFRESFKPAHVVHLGDAWDLASLRSGALSNSGDADVDDDYKGDIESGIAFLNALRPTVFCLGNHDERAKRYLTDHRAVVRCAAEAVWGSMTRCIKKHAKVFIQHNDVFDRSFHVLGGVKFGHGVLFSENFIRDSAETFGNCVVAHAHRAGSATGRRSDNPVCLSPGTLADVPCMEYAHKRRSTLAWSHGIVFGEVTDTEANLYVHQWHQGETKWKIPSF